MPRYKLIFTPSKGPIQRNVTNHVSWLHKVLGNNNKWHSAKHKTYSISEMLRGKYNKETNEITYENGGLLIVNSDDRDFLRKIKADAEKFEFGNGMKCVKVIPTDDSIWLNEDKPNFFRVSPQGILLYELGELKKRKQLLFNNRENWLNDLTEITKNRLLNKDPNLDVSDLKFEFVADMENNYISKVKYKNYEYLTNCVTLMVSGSIDVKEMILTYGLGHCTSSGFGMVYPTENTCIYK